MKLTQLGLVCLGTLGLCTNLASAANLAGVPLHGFADVDAGWGTADTPEDLRPRAFNLGTLDFYLTPQFTGNVRGLFEIAIEAPEGEIVLDLERIQLAYTFSDLLTVWAGRFHTPYGYWNTAFHHGAQIQPSIRRPRFLGFEDLGGVLPSHAVGLWATGSQKFSDSRLNYDLYAVNADKIDGVATQGGEPTGVLNFNAAKDDNTNIGLGGRLSYDFGGKFEGLTLGGFAMSMTVNGYHADETTQEITMPSSEGVKFFGPYLAYEGHNVEIYGEFYRFINSNYFEQDVNYASSAGYIQAGYHVTDYLVPYLRYEQASLNQSDAYFASQASGRSYSRDVAGLRIPFNDVSVIKFEMLHTSYDANTGTVSFNEGAIQYAVAF